MSIRHSLLLLVAAFLTAPMASAAVKLPALFGDNMVLQQGVPVPIWGWADANETVSVSVDGKTKTTTAGPDGKWSVKLDPMRPGKPRTINISGKNHLVLSNVLVGEVWVCAGQSNMTFGINMAHDAKTEIPKANYPDIRLFTVPSMTALQPQADMATAPVKHPLERAWQVCTPEVVQRDGGWGGFSAVAYFFGRDLHEALHVPVGLIHASWVGTPAQSWTSLRGLESSPELAEYVNAINNAHAKAASGEVDPQIPTVLNNGMIQPIIPYAIRGVIWYQGESNTHQAITYRTLFPALIEDWRQRWGQGDFPFIFVQIASCWSRKPQPSESNWAILREAQAMALSVPNTAMAVTIDIGLATSVHPKDKSDVGHRLMLAAEHVAYGKNVVYSGPVYDKMNVEGGSIRLHFQQVGSGLMIGSPPSTIAGEPATAPADHLEGFAIAGQDRKFVWANARIDGDAILVSSPQVPRPVAVRYAWADNPEANLYNKEHLPAIPFRTDQWPPEK